MYFSTAVVNQVKKIRERCLSLLNKIPEVTQSVFKIPEGYVRNL